VLFYNLLQYVLSLADSIILGIVDKELAAKFGLVKYRFVWELTFALFSDPTWDFETNSVTLPIDDISWIGYFNDSETMGFGTGAGLSVRGNVSASLKGVFYDLQVYVLTPDKDIPIKELKSGAHFQSTRHETSTVAGLLLFPPMSRIRLGRSTRLRHGLSVLATIDNIVDALESSSTDVVATIVGQIQANLPLVLDHLKLETISCYLTTVFEPEFLQIKPLLLDGITALKTAINQFSSAYGPYRGIETTAPDIIDKDKTPNATLQQLMDLKGKLESAYRDLRPVADFLPAVISVEEASGEMQSPKNSSLVVFQRVNYVQAHKDFWDQAEKDWSDLDTLVTNARSLYRPGLCDRIADLLLALADRLEWERLNSTIADFRALSEQIVQALRDGARRLGAVDFRNRLLAEARAAQTALQATTTALQFVRSQALVIDAEARLLPNLALSKPYAAARSMRL
jgi:hypothetical protein